jgi:hypothetical protein
LFGVLVVQTCESSLRDAGHVTHQTIKTCIATISPKTIGASSYLACKLPSPPSLSTPDGFYIVYTVFVLETLQTALSGADLYYWFASGYGDMNHLASPFASTFDIPLIESLVSAMVQYFYAYRVWALSNKQSRWFCLIICLVGRSQSSPKHPYSVHCFLPCSAPPSTQWEDSLVVYMFVLSSVFPCILAHCRRLV